MASIQETRMEKRKEVFLLCSDYLTTPFFVSQLKCTRGILAWPCAGRPCRQGRPPPATASGHTEGVGWPPGAARLPRRPPALAPVAGERHTRGRFRFANGRGRG
ncbi:hypothetical protein R1flu_017250 [Riccia fluitans]|uniref:Uncharacterized protein n=1 Tax=Riccia fluitans TaxID=41844 RepID=A0ABD1XED7_9MARC